VLGAGYPIGGATEPLADLHKRWLPFAGDLVRSATAYSAEQGRRPSLAVGSGDLLVQACRTPDGRELVLWWRDIEPPAYLYD
jgi:hypothetical protein